MNARADSRTSHGEEFHDFTGEVLVRRSLDILSGIQKAQHGRVLRHGDDEIAEIARAPGLKKLELVEQLAIVADLVLIVGEVAVPEQRHLLLQRRIGGEHPVCPPVSDAIGLKHAGPQPIEELVGDRLKRPVAGCLCADPQRLARFLRAIGSCGPAFGERLEPGLVYAGVIEWLKVFVVGFAKINQAADSLTSAYRGQPCNLFRRSTEAGACQQMRCALGVSVIR